MGYTLPSTHVTTSEIPISDTLVGNLYSFIILVWYISTLIVFCVWYNYIGANDQIDRIHRWMENNESLISGMITTAAIASIFDGFARIINGCIINIHAPGLGVFLAVWLPQTFHLLVGPIVMLRCIAHCCERNNGFKHGYLILSLHCFVIALLQMLIPTIILALAYPTQMLAIVTFVLTYLFATTILATIIIKGFINAFETTQQWQWRECLKCNNVCYAVASFIVIITVILITICIVLIFMYLVLIGRGSAINTGPLYIISLAPSVIVAGVFWIVKKIVLNN